MPSLLHAIECECCVRRTGFIVFTKVLIINNSKVVITVSYTDIGRHINKLINVS